LTVAGVAGAYSYGQNYYLHRGFATLVQLRRAGTGQLLKVSFFSRALNRRASYLVYLPPGYNPARRYPVYYLLHGMPGRPQVFIDIANMDVRLDNQLSLGHAQPMILVYPDGRIGGNNYSDSEWANTSAESFEAYVMEVVDNVDHRFSTLRYRQDRVIGGFSAGGYGAINIALHQLSTFASVQVWSGISRRPAAASSAARRTRPSGTTARSITSRASAARSPRRACVSTCSSVVTTRQVVRSCRWPAHYEPMARASSTRSTQAVTTGRSGTRASIRC